MQVYWISLVLICVIGFFNIANVSVALELALELCVPVGESISCGVLVSSSQLLGVALTYLTGFIYDRTDGLLGSQIALVILDMSILVALILLYFVKEGRVRLIYNDSLVEQCEPLTDKSSLIRS